jgi:hypothetical protein
MNGDNYGGFMGELMPRAQASRRLYIEAITVCVDYSDFLAHSILFNKAAFDRLLVVTAPHDEPTRRICDYHDVEYLVTPEFYVDGNHMIPSASGKGRIFEPVFSKARGINAGLKVLSKSDWVVHIDADIVMPPRARDLFEVAQPLPTHLHGIDRLMLKNYDDWVKHLAYPELQHEPNFWIRGNSFPLNVRIGPHRDAGWIPAGFFQMWHPRTSGISTYPQDHSTSAGRTDVMFSFQFPRERRALIPEIFAIHLESEETMMAANWKGRRTRFFGPAGMERHIVQHIRKEWL